MDIDITSSSSAETLRLTGPIVVTEARTTGIGPHQGSGVLDEPTIADFLTESGTGDVAAAGGIRGLGWNRR